MAKPCRSSGCQSATITPNTTPCQPNITFELHCLKFNKFQITYGPHTAVHSTLLVALYYDLNAKFPKIDRIAFQWWTAGSVHHCSSAQNLPESPRIPKMVDSLDNNWIITLVDKGKLVITMLATGHRALTNMQTPDPDGTMVLGNWQYIDRHAHCPVLYIFYTFLHDNYNNLKRVQYIDHWGLEDE